LVPHLVNGSVEIENNCRYWVKGEIESTVDGARRTYTFDDRVSRTGSFFSNQPYRIVRELNYVRPTGAPNARYIRIRTRAVGGQITWEAYNRSGFYVDLGVDFPDYEVRRRGILLSGAFAHALVPPGKTLRIMAYSKVIPHTIKVAVADPL
jgi:hypothetical protein